MRLRVSIRMLLAVVALLAVVIAVWRGATEVWAFVVFNLIVLTLLVASFKARYSRGTEGAWWFGFALCGWAYLVLAVVPKFLTSDRTYLTPVDALLSNTLDFMGQELLGVDNDGTAKCRYLILQSMVTLPNALIGAALCRFFATRMGTSASQEEGTSI